jgi:hypothetical protein
MANRKQNLRPDGALGRASALWLPCAASDVIGPVRFKLQARFISGRNTVFMSKVSLFT